MVSSEIGSYHQVLSITRSNGNICNVFWGSGVCIILVTNSWKSGNLYLTVGLLIDGIWHLGKAIFPCIELISVDVHDLENLGFMSWTDLNKITCYQNRGVGI